MPGAAGYVLVLDEDRREVFEYSLAEMRFAEPVLEFSHSRQRPLVCFIDAIPGQITHIARGRRGSRAGTGLRRLNVEDIYALKRPLRVADVLSGVPSRVRPWLQARLESGGLVPPKSFEALVTLATRLSPETASVLSAYSASRRRRIARLPERAKESLGQQKEAVATALTLAGIQRTELEGWDTDPGGVPTSYLDGLPEVRLREDQMLIHDLHTLPGYDAIKSMPHPAVVFDDGRTRLTVVLTNRLPLEEQLGVDLIYYNETYRSFVMVQYKAMEKSTTAGAQWLFRLPDAQLESEIARMDGVMSQLGGIPGVNDVEAYRLCGNPFFLKLCPRVVFEPDNTGLVAGMYLPLDYWKLLGQDEGIVGPNGGRAVTYSNAGRHFDNSSFVFLVAGGWLGTNVAQSAVLERCIRESLESGHAVVLAVRSDAPEDDAGAQ